MSQMIILYIIFIFILNKAFINPDRISSSYSSAYLLPNNDIFLVLENRISVYDSTLSTEKHNHNLNSDQQITSSSDAETISIAQFSTESENNNIILSLVKKNIFIFSSEGEYLFEKDLSDNLQGTYYSLIAHKYNNIYYNYIISFFSEGFININYYNLSLVANQTALTTSIKFKPINSLNVNELIMYYGLSCNIMISSENKEVLSCFYQSTNPAEIGVNSFEISENEITNLENLRAYISHDRAQVIKSAVSEDKKKALICFAEGYTEGGCVNYNIELNQFSGLQIYFNQCRGNAIGTNAYYFKDTNEFMFICCNNQKGFKMVTFNENFEENIEGENSLTVANYQYGGTCYNIRTFSIIYIKGLNGYTIINDCEGNSNIFSTGRIQMSNLIDGNNNYPDDEEVLTPVDGIKSTNILTELNDKTIPTIIISTTIPTTMMTTIITTSIISTTIKTNMIKTTILTSSTISTTIISTIIQTTKIITTIPTSIIGTEIPNNTIISTTIPNTIKSTTIPTTIISTTIPININNEADTTIYSNINTIIVIQETQNEIKTNSNIFIEKTSKKREEIITNLDSLMKDKDPNRAYIIKGNDFSVIIKPINEIVEESSVNIDFSECEKILKEENSSANLILLQVNMENSNKKCLTDQVEYKIYNDKKEPIDLSSCKNIEIKIEYEIKNISSLNIQEISNFKGIGVDVFDIKDNFFNDICYPYSDNNSNSDMILTDRVSDIYQNYSLCGENCKYDSFNIEKISANCNCKVKQGVDSEIKEGNFENYVENSFLESNFGVIKCFNLVFNLKGKLNNYGFWIFGIMTIIHLPIYILYCINGLNPIKHYINKEMIKEGYIAKNIKSQISQEAIPQTDNIINNNMNSENKRYSIYDIKDIKEYEGNPPKRGGIIKNNYRDRNRKFTIIKLNSENIKNNNNLQLNDSEITDDSLSNEKNKKINAKKSIKSMIRVNEIDKISEESNRNNKLLKEDSDSSYKNEQKLNNIIFSTKNVINQRKRKTVMHSFKTFDILKNKDKEADKINNANMETEDREIKRKRMERRRRRFTIIKSNNILNLEDKDSNINFINNNKTKKNSMLSKETFSPINSYYNFNKMNKNEILEKDYQLIKINANNEEDYFPLKSKYILNNYDFTEAILYDNRKYFRIFFIYLISKENILNLIFLNPPLELKPLRISICIFSYACDIALNALFYLSDNISDKYKYKGENKILFSIFNNLIISLVSTIVSYLLLNFFQSLTQSSDKIENIFREEECILKNDKHYKVNDIKKIKIKDEVLTILKCLRIKIIFFIVFEHIFMLFFFYYVTAFCEVYKSTQTSWLLDCISSYVISLLTTFVVSFLFSFLYKISIKYKVNGLYKVCIFIYSFG